MNVFKLDDASCWLLDSAQSSVMSYAEEDVPEARFNYDVSPMSVIVKKTGRRYADGHSALACAVGLYVSSVRACV